jgi:FRG domain
MTRQKVASLTDYLQAVNEVLASWNEHNARLTPWFRGVSGVRPELVPALYRGRFAPLDANDECDLMLEFKRVAASLQHGLPHHTRHIDWLAIAQHHGLPTRLLDWTESSLAALFFALENTRSGMSIPQEAGVWMLHPDWLNQRAGVADRVLVLTDEPANHEIDRRWGSLQAPESGVDPIAIRPVQLATRVAAQSGVFTLFGTAREPLDRLPDAARYLVRIDIDKTAIPKLREELQRAGVTAVTLFPDLDGLSRYLKAVFAQRAEDKEAHAE